jgi:drug/metabolite transporter (DMT)-like permease
LNSPAKSRALGGFFITLAAAILFSTKAVLVKSAFKHTHADAVSLLALRMVFSIPFYIAAALWAMRKQATAPSGKQWIWILVLGVLGYYLSSLFDFMGLQYVSAGLERLILFLYPTFALLINGMVFKQKVTRVQLGALVLTYLGISIAFADEWARTEATGPVLWGSFLVLLCAITYASYIVGSSQVLRKMNATLFTAYAMLVSTFAILLHYLIRGDYGLFDMERSLWIYGILLAIIATVIPSFLLSFGMQKLGANRVSIILAIGPISTILQAWLFLDERVTGAQIIGALLVTAGVVWIGWKKEKA